MGSGEIIFLTFLGMFAVPEREGQTKEDFLQEIFEMRLQGSTRRYPSGILRDATAREHKKISFRNSSRCDCKGAQEDIL
jgi:hypothetical protein